MKLLELPKPWKSMYLRRKTTTFYYILIPISFAVLLLLLLSDIGQSIFHSHIQKTSSLYNALMFMAVFCLISACVLFLVWYFFTRKWEMNDWFLRLKYDKDLFNYMVTSLESMLISKSKPYTIQELAFIFTKLDYNTGKPYGRLITINYEDNIEIRVRITLNYTLGRGGDNPDAIYLSILNVTEKNRPHTIKFQREIIDMLISNNFARFIIGNE